MKLWQALGLTGLGAGVAYVVWRHVKTSNGSGPSMSSSTSTSPAISTTPAHPATTISTPLSSNAAPVQVAPASTLPPVAPPAVATATVVPMATPGASLPALPPELAALQNAMQQVNNLSPQAQTQLLQASQQMQTLFPNGPPTSAELAANPQAQALMQQMQALFPPGSIPSGTPVDMAPAITSGRVRGIGPNGNPHRRVRRA